MVATRSTSVKATLLELYKQAYRNAPRRFFTQYRAATQGNNKLRNAIRQVAGILFTGQTEGMVNAVATDPVARDLCEKYLVQEWGLLNGDYVLQKPTDLRLHQAWNILEKQFSPGVKDKKLASPLVQLINPPNGYDYNTVTLLFAAWFGYHAHDCTLTRNGRETRVDVFAKFLEKGPKDLLLNLRADNVALSRRNPDDTRIEVQDLVRRVRTSGTQLSIHEAENAYGKLVAFSQDSRNNARECEDAQTAAEFLNGAIEKAKDYEQQVVAVIETINAEKNLSRLVETLEVIRNLPRLAIVKTDMAQPAELNDALQKRIESYVEQACQSLEQPTATTDVGLYRRQIQGLQVTLEKSGLSQFIPRVARAVQRLEENAAALKAQESEEGIRRMLNDVNASSPLAQLLEKRTWLAGLDGYSEELLQQRDRKLRDVDEAITQLETQVAALPTSIESANTQHKVDELRDHWNRNLMRYDGSNHYGFIEDGIDRLNKLREFFQHIGQLPRQVRQPKDLASLQQQVDSLRKLYTDYLSPVHLSLLADLEQGHQSSVVTQQNAAIQWLQECTSEVNALVGTSGSRVNGLVDKLNKPPAFLPESNVAKLEQLKQQVQEKLDGDTMLQVEAAFRKIKDYQRQQECLHRLQSILNAESAKSALG